MTRKDYVVIAAIIRSNMDRANEDERWRLQVVADELASAFAAENPRFDTDKFLEACGAPVFKTAEWRNDA